MEGSTGDGKGTEQANTEVDWRSQKYPVCRGVRGATTVPTNTAEAILEATREMLVLMIERNGIRAEDVASVIFSTTADLTAEYPAIAARQLGWHEAALMCGHEMAVPHGLKMCLRVLIHWNTTRTASEIQHVYIRGAVNLRPDRSVEIKGLTNLPTRVVDVSGAENP